MGLGCEKKSVKRVGKGTFAEVLGCGKECKKYFFYDLDVKGYSFLRELSVMHSFQGPQFPQLLGIYRQDNPKYESLCLEMEKYSKNLDQVKGKLKWENFVQILRDVVEALNIMHSVDVVHSDVKLNNILMKDRRKRGVLIDFGYSGPYKMFGETAAWEFMDERILPPEQKNAKFPTKQLDIWSLGNCLLRYVTNGQVVNTIDMNEVREKIEKSMNDNIQKEKVMEFLQCTLTYEEKRKTCEELLSLSIFNGTQGPECFSAEVPYGFRCTTDQLVEKLQQDMDISKEYALAFCHTYCSIFSWVKYPPEIDEDNLKKIQERFITDILGYEIKL